MKSEDTAHHLHLGYHYLSPEGEKKPGLCCDLGLFVRQLDALKEGNYFVWTLSKFVGAIQSRLPLPRKLATISFDDGLRDGYELAYPLLKRYGFKASFLPIGCALDGRLPPVIAFQALIKRLGAERLETEILPRILAGTPYVTLLDPGQYDIRDAKWSEPPEMRRIKWVFNHFLPASFQLDVVEEIFETYLPGAEGSLVREYFFGAKEVQEMAEAGMDFVSHSYCHPQFTTLGASAIRDELQSSRAIIRHCTDSEPSCFAWPFGGRFSDKVKQAVRGHHGAAFNFYGRREQMPPESFRYADLYDLPRWDGGSWEPG